MNNTHETTDVFTCYNPAEAGIPADSILSFLDCLDKYQVNMHSLLIMRHDKLVAEGYYAPYKADTLHRMFSICKTLNALGIGLLKQEGKLNLDDPVIHYFPDKIMEPVHPWIAEMTIRNLLMMRTCHASTTYKNGAPKEWVESFFTTAPTHKPGTVFHYDTSAAHVLCVLVERLAKKPMLEYLKEKVLNTIGWSPQSYVLKNPYGDSQGGSGLMATPRDLLLLAKLLMQKGAFRGKQLLPRDYIEEMTSCLTPNAITGGVISEAQGYGYQLWQTRYSGFVCYGMGGQLALCLPKHDLILVTTADTQGCGGGNDLIYNSFYETILPALDTVSGASLEEAISTKKLEDRLKRLSLTSVRKWCHATPGIKNITLTSSETCAAQINGIKYHLMSNPQAFDHVCLSLTDQTGKFYFGANEKEYEICFGLDSCVEGNYPIYDMHYAASGMWLSKDTFYIKIHILDTSIGSVHIEFVFANGEVTIFMKKIEETLLNEFSGHFHGYQENHI